MGPLWDQLPDDVRSRYREYEARIGELLPDVPEPIRTRRLMHAQSLCLRVCAVRERAHQRGAVEVPLALHVNELIDLLIGVLTAEVSAATRAALASEQTNPVRAS